MYFHPNSIFQPNFCAPRSTVRTAWNTGCTGRKRRLTTTDCRHLGENSTAKATQRISAGRLFFYDNRAYPLSFGLLPERKMLLLISRLVRRSTDDDFYGLKQMGMNGINVHLHGIVPVYNGILSVNGARESSRHSRGVML